MKPIEVILHNVERLAHPGIDDMENTTYLPDGTAHRKLCFNNMNGKIYDSHSMEQISDSDRSSNDFSSRVRISAQRTAAVDLEEQYRRLVFVVFNTKDTSAPCTIRDDACVIGQGPGDHLFVKSVDAYNHIRRLASGK